MLQQRAQFFILVDEWNDFRPRLTVMYFSGHGVPAFELGDDPFNVILHHALQVKKSKRCKKVFLLLRQCHRLPLYDWFKVLRVLSRSTETCARVPCALSWLRRRYLRSANELRRAVRGEFCG